MRNSLLNGFSQIHHNLSATGREIHRRAVDLCYSAAFVRTCVTLDKTYSDMFFLGLLSCRAVFKTLGILRGTIDDNRGN